MVSSLPTRDEALAQQDVDRHSEVSSVHRIDDYQKGYQQGLAQEHLTHPQVTHHTSSQGIAELAGLMGYPHQVTPQRAAWVKGYCAGTKKIKHHPSEEKSDAGQSVYKVVQVVPNVLHPAEPYRCSIWSQGPGWYYPEWCYVYPVGINISKPNMFACATYEAAWEFASMFTSPQPQNQDYQIQIWRCLAWEVTLPTKRLPGLHIREFGKAFWQGNWCMSKEKRGEDQHGRRFDLADSYKGDRICQQICLVEQALLP